MTKKFVLTALVILLTAPLAFADAAPQGDEGEHSFTFRAMGESAGVRGIVNPRAFHRIARYLDLTEDQRDAIRQIFEQTRGEGEPIRSEMRILREEMKTLLDSDADAAEVGSVAKELHALRGQVKDLRADVQDQVKAELTAEQIDRLEDMQEFRRERRERRHQRRAGRRHGE